MNSVLEPDTSLRSSDIEAEDLLKKAFAEFQARAEKLSHAYSVMQEEFKKVNIELEQKNRELASSLQKQEEVQTYLSSILESMHNGVIGVDPNGMITHFNRAASEITGYSAQSMLRRPYADFFIRENSSDNSLLLVIESGKEQKRAEKVIWRYDGSPVPVAFQTSMLRDKNGTAIGAVEIFTDMTRIKALEREMQQHKTMAALGEMSASVAHEIRNPLGAMGVWAGLLSRELATDDPKKKLVNKITEGLARLNHIVSNLLVYARPVEAQLHAVDLEHILHETIDFIEIEIERLGQQIHIEKFWDANACTTVNADPEKIQQVIMNLCLNAIQAMPKGGVLTVTVDNGEKSESKYASFNIADTGVGIEIERIDRIFDPFHTTKENGTGLGLAIVKKFVELHSGYIDIKSVVDQGTTIKVFLPKA